jgi:peptide/nickel transport system ATP-binding protein
MSTDTPGTPDGPLIRVEALRKVFRGRHGSPDVTAVDGVAFTVGRGESLAVVGESGSGKTTVARMITGLEHPTSGTIEVAGRVRPPGRAGAAERRRRARETQIVFQDPYGSLDPRQRVRDALGEILALHFDMSRDARGDRVEELLGQVGLDARVADALPRAMSGGQRQRVAIAKALATRPSVLVLDEAVAALDVSIQAQVLNLLADIRAASGISFLFISHDLAVVRQVTDRAVVMRNGVIVEENTTADLLDHPSHPYTRLLRASVPGPGWTPRRRTADTAAEG